MKLRLGKEAHDKLVSLLASEQKAVYEQENFFFDGVNQELTSRRCVMRVRFYNTDEKAVLTVKGRMNVVDGVGVAQEEEDEIDPITARGCVHCLTTSRIICLVTGCDVYATCG